MGGELYYRFKSDKDFKSVQIDNFISVWDLKLLIVDMKRLEKGNDFDLKIFNAKNNQEYTAESTLIPAYTSVLLQRVPRPSMPLVVKNKEVNTQQAKRSQPVSDLRSPASEWNQFDFGDDSYIIKDEVPYLNKIDEDRKIKALTETSTLNCQWQTQKDVDTRTSGFSVKVMGGRVSGRCRILESKTPLPGYICNRCKLPGHFIQHCPTNCDPDYDIKRVPNGIPLPNEAAFEKEIGGMPSTTRQINDIPSELWCPICKKVMQDAAIASKCCFTSFCDKCIRNHILSNLMCVCGGKSTLADDLLPNKTLRDTIAHLLESDAKYALPVQCKSTSSDLSLTSKREQMPPTREDADLDVKKTEDVPKHVSYSYAPQESSEKAQSKASMMMKEATSQDSAPVANEKVQRNPSACESAKKKKKKKVALPGSGDLQWRGPNDVAKHYMMPFAPSYCNPYWGAMQLGMGGLMNPYAGTMPPYMSYTSQPCNVQLGGVLPQDSIRGQGYRMPVPPPKDGSRNMEYNGEVSGTGDISSMKPHHRSMLPSPSSNNHEKKRKKHSPEHSSNYVTNRYEESKATTAMVGMPRKSRTYVLPDDNDIRYEDDDDDDDDERHFKRKRRPSRYEWDRESERGRRATTTTDTLHLQSMNKISYF